MKISVTYIFHNCFVVTFPERTLLFDYPEGRMLSSAAKTRVKELTAGKPLTVFFSHSHADHFTPRFEEWEEHSNSVRFILAEEICSRLSREQQAKVHLIDAGASLSLDEMNIRAFKSNDLGVAFYLRYQGLGVYFGGDLAAWEWDWEENEQEEAEFIRTTWNETLNSLKDYPVDLAFSNADARLKNWSGAAEFIAKINPGWFVPMHTFGKPQVLRRFFRTLPSTARIMRYERMGDTWEIEV